MTNNKIPLTAISSSAFPQTAFAKAALQRGLFNQQNTCKIPVVYDLSDLIVYENVNDSNFSLCIVQDSNAKWRFSYQIVSLSKLIVSRIIWGIRSIFVKLRYILMDYDMNITLVWSISWKKYNFPIEFDFEIKKIHILRTIDNKVWCHYFA